MNKSKAKHRSRYKNQERGSGRIRGSDTNQGEPDNKASSRMFEDEYYERGFHPSPAGHFKSSLSYNHSLDPLIEGTSICFSLILPNSFWTPFRLRSPQTLSFSSSLVPLSSLLYPSTLSNPLSCMSSSSSSSNTLRFVQPPSRSAGDSGSSIKGSSPSLRSHFCLS